MAVRGLIASAVLLDALGTLVELAPPAPRLRAELRERFGLDVSPAQAAAAIAAEIGYYRAHLDQGRDETSLAALRARCATVLAAELERLTGQAVPSGEEMVSALMAALEFRAFPDVPDALTQLRGLGVRLVVVSNWDISLSGVLERLGIRRLLDGVVTSAEVGVRKPAPAAFERGLILAGARPREALHVGDSPLEDVQGALRAGISPVLIVRQSAPAAPADSGPTTIRTLLELPPLLSAEDGRGSSHLV